MPSILITGCNRGLGLEFARQYAEAGWEVIATARDPSTAPELSALSAAHANLRVEKLDVMRLEDIGALRERLGARPIDVLLNNAGILGDRQKQSFTELDYAEFEAVLRTNTYAPLAMARAFLENVAASEQKKIVVITSGLSSIEAAIRFGSLPYYRISKAGVNMAMRVLQAEVRPRGIRVGILAPGMVDTRLLRTSGYQGPGVITAPESVTAVRGHIERLDQSATMTLYTGEKLPW